MSERAAAATVIVYSKPDCHLCSEAIDVLRRLQRELAQLAFTIEEHDITGDERLHRAYFDRIPVVAVNGEELCEYHVSEARVRERLESFG
jgi:glutaredoxin